MKELVKNHQTALHQKHRPSWTVLSTRERVLDYDSHHSKASLFSHQSGEQCLGNELQ